MMLRPLRAVLAALALLTGCNFKLTRSNPLDPSAPPEMQRVAQITGHLLLEDNASSEGAEIAVVGARLGEDQARRIDTQPIEDGSFLLEAPAGTYTLTVKLPGYVAQPIAGITVAPGESYDVGELYLTVLRGSIRGFVRMQDGAAREPKPAKGAIVTLVRDGGEGTAGDTTCGQNGDYRLDGLPAGTYSVKASLADFVPGQPKDKIVIAGGQVATAPEVTLYPASAIVRIRAGGTSGAKFTNTRAVEVELLAFVENLTHMRVSLDPSFADATLGDTTFIDFAASRPFQLADADGTQTVYAQFQDSDGHVSDTFSGAIMLDRGPPVVSAFSVGDGSAFVTSSIVPILASGLDALSGIDRYRLSIDGTLDTEPELATDSVSNVIALDLAQSLGNQDGAKDVVFVWIDRAGNVSAETHVPLYKDTQAPATTAPAISIAGGAAKTGTTAVTLTFQVTGDRMGEPLYVALATAMGQSSNAARIALADAGNYTLSSGDGTKTVCAKFFDAAGNASAESCDSIDLDTTGGLHGVVQLEGTATWSGVTVTLTDVNGTSPLPPAVTNAVGVFSFSNVPQGVGYKLTFTNAPNYGAIVDQDVTVISGLDQDRGTYQMSLTRSGKISGVVTLEGAASYQGTTVAALSTAGAPSVYTTATTSSDGSWSMTGLPLGPYTFTVSHAGFGDDGYTPLTLVDSADQNLGTLQLGTQVGDFKICNGSEVPANSCVINVTLTNEKNLKLGFTLDMTTRDYFVNETAIAPALTGSTGWSQLDAVETYALPNGPSGMTGPLNGQHTIYVWYRDQAQTTLDGPYHASVTYDDVPPTTGSVSINGGAAYTTSQSVTLTLAASDATSGVSRMILSNDDAVFNETPQNFVATLNGYSLPASEAAHTVYAQYCDRANNCQPTPAQATIIYDHTPPTGTSFSIDNGNTYATTPFVSLTLGSDDAVAVRYGTSSNLDALDWTGTATGPVSLPIALQGIDGDKTIYVQWKDAAGNVTTPAASDDIRLDRAPPSVTTFTFTQGAVTNSANVTLQIAAVAEVPAVTYTLSSNPTFTGAPAFTGIVSPAAFTLSAGEGDKIVYGRFKDAAGNTVDTSATITLDTTAPNATFSLDGDAGYTLDKTVTVTLSGSTETITGYKLVNEVAPSCNAVIFDGSLLANWDIDDSVQGLRTVYLCVRDAAGNTRLLADTIFYDSGTPTGSVQANGTDLYTTSAQVLLTLTVTDTGAGVAEMKVSNDVAFAGAVYEPFTSTKSWTLKNPTTDEPKTVYVRFKDLAGRENDFNDTITLDRTPPVVGVSIATGATYATSPTVSVNVTGPADAAFIAHGEAIDCATATYSTPFTPPAMQLTGVTLTGADGLKSYTVCLQDGAGWKASGTDTIALDTVDPAVSVLIDGGAAYALSTSVSLTLNASDDVDPVNGLKIYAPTGPTGCPTSAAAYGVYSTPKPATIGSSDGAQSVFVCVRDRSGRVSQVATDDITYDSAPPNLGATLTVSGYVGPNCQNDGVFSGCGTSSTLTKFPNVRVSFTSTETPQYALGPATLDCASTSYQSLTGSSPFTLPYVLTGGQTAQAVKLCVKDAAGRTSTLTSSNITLDTTAPSVTTFAIVEGALANTGVINVSMATTVEAPPVQYILSTNPSFTGAAAFTGITSPVAFDVGSGEGDKTVYGRFKDAAGNTTDMSDTITIDRTAPDATLVLESGASHTQSQTVAVSLINTTETIANYKLSNTVPNCNDPSGYAAFLSGTWALASTEGTRTVYLCIKDAAGNARQISDTIFYDTADPTGSIVINLSTDLYTTSAQVLLSLGAGDGGTGSGVSEMMVSNESNFSGASYEVFTSTKIWTLKAPTTDELKTVYVRFKDASGRTVDKNDTITLDTTPPTVAVSLNFDADYTSSATVSVGVTGSVDSAQYAHGEAIDCATTGYTGLTGPTFSLPSVTLTGADGVKAYTVCIKDSAGLIGSGTDTIALDTVDPTVSVLINNDAAYATSTTVSLNLTASDDVDLTNGLKVYAPTGPSGCPTTKSSYGAFANPKTGVSIGSTDGAQSVYVCVRDRAGRVSSVATDSITYDSAAPTISSFTVHGAIGKDCLNDGVFGAPACTGSMTLTKFANVQVDFTLGESGLYRALGSSTLDCASASYQELSGPPTFTNQPYVLTGGETSQAVKLCVKDAAGRTVSATSNNILLDTTAPPTLSFDYVTAANHSLTLGWSASSATDVDYYFTRIVPIAPTGPATQQTIDATLATSYSQSAVGLKNCGQYGLTIAAVDNAGNHQFSPPTIGSPVLPPPTDVEAVGEYGEALVSWTEPVAALSYRIDYQQVPGGVLSSMGPTGVSGINAKFVTNLSEGMTYGFSVSSYEDQDPGPGVIACFSAASAQATTKIFATDALAEFLGSQSFEQYGSALASGDLDGDGWTDLVIGEPLREQFLSSGSSAGDTINDFGGIEIREGFDKKARSAHMHEGLQDAGTKAGSAVAVIPDINNDGIDDIVVGAPGRDIVDVLSGADGTKIKRLQPVNGPSGPTGDALVEFGTAVAGGSDVDNDGYADIAVAAKGVGSPGRVYIYSGRTLTAFNPSNGLTDGASISFGSAIAGGARFQTSCTNAACAGFLVGSPAANEVLIAYYDRTGTPQVRLGGRTNGGSNGFGSSLALLGDGDGDGLIEVAIGAPGSVATAGAVRIFEAANSGVGPSFVPGALVEDVGSGLTGTTGETFGTALAVTSRLQDDDPSFLLNKTLVIGAPTAMQGANSVGRVAAYGYRRPGVGLKLLYNRMGRFSSGNYGVALAGGDFDNDGRGDFAVGINKAPGVPGADNGGRVEVVRGNALGLIPYASGILAHDSKSYSGRGGTPDYTLGLQSPPSGTTMLDGVVAAGPTGVTASVRVTDDKSRTFDATIEMIRIQHQTLPTTGWPGQFGSTIVSVGDWNGDGYSEIAVGEPELNGNSDGRVTIINGKDRSLFGTYQPIGFPDFNPKRCGKALASVGDLDGDGRAELAVGCPSAGGNGQVHILRGVQSGNPTRLGTPLVTAYPNGPEEFGASLAFLGRFFERDVGYVTLAVGMPSKSSNQGGGEFVTFRWNGASFESPPYTRTLFPLGDLDTNGHIGATLGAADMDGDGIRELLVGAPNHGGNSGRVMVVRGGFDQPVIVSDFTTNTADAGYGTSMTVIPDQDGDNFADLVLGGPRFTAQGAFKTGIAWVVSGLSGSLFGVIPSLGTASSFGSAVANVGDVDRDGYPDIAIGAPSYSRDGALNDCGAVFLYSTRDFQPFFFVPGDTPAQGLGNALAGGFDVGWPIATATARDNNPDWIAGASAGGAVRLFVTESP